MNKSQNLFWFILGLLSSIPIGIFVNLETKNIENWMIKKKIGNKVKNYNRLKKQYERVKNYHDNPSKLQHDFYSSISYGVRVIMVLITMSIMMTIITTGIVAFQQISLNSSVKVPETPLFLVNNKWIPFVFLYVIGIFFFLVMNSIFKDTIESLLFMYHDNHRLADFDKYEQETLAELAELSKDPQVSAAISIGANK